MLSRLPLMYDGSPEDKTQGAKGNAHPSVSETTISPSPASFQETMRSLHEPYFPPQTTRLDAGVLVMEDKL
ncbi:hypothetical protein NQZ68_023816 [Dissostichus eleginoides]|nr:hypothetical protein NQZ68_023816 [Dissostichus eleginoides]